MRANTEKVGLINWALMILLGVPKAAVLEASLPLDYVKILESIHSFYCLREMVSGVLTDCIHGVTLRVPKEGCGPGEAWFSALD